jgi:hypothetical protein
LFAIFNPQYSLISFKNLPLDMCMCFHLFILDMHTILEEFSLCWPSKLFFCPFWQWMPMGEKFRGFKGNWVLYFGFVLKHLPLHALHRCVLLRMVEYIAETPPTILVGNICNEIKIIHICIDCGGVCPIYGGSTNITYFCSI